MKKLFTSIIFFSLLITSKNSYAQWSNDPNQNLRISNFGYFVDACEDGMGGAFVGWMTGNTNYPTVWLQWIDKYGYIKWNSPLQLKGEGEAQGGFKLIKSDIGKVIVYFGDNKIVAIPPPPYPGPIYERTLLMQKIDTTGRLLWGDKGIKITTTKSIPDSISFNALDIVSDGDFGTYITWTYGYGKYHDSTVTRIQRISKDGQRLWGDEGKYIYTWYGVNAPSPSLGERKPDGVFLLYDKQNFKNTIASINPDMTIKWEKTNEWLPYKKLIPDENMGAAWATLIYPASWDTGYTLIANRINANGDLLWNDSGVVIERKLESGWVGNIHQKFLKDESFLILYGNYLQAVKKNGELVFQDGKFYYGNFENTNHGLEIFESDSSNFIITWLSTRYGSNEYLCQKFNGSFEKLWGQDNLFSRYTHEELALIPDGRGGFIDAFSVYYPATPGILMQQVSSNGVLGEVLTTITENNISDPENFRLYQNYPNPFNPTTQIQYVLPSSSNIIVTVYNSLGQTVKVFNEGTKEAGNHNITFNGEVLASGIYFYSVQTVSTAGKQNFTAAKKMLLLK